MSRDLEAIILVGGQGTRLRSVLSDTPKPLAPVEGSTFLDYLLRQLEQTKRISKVVFATGYQAHQIHERYQKHHYSFQIDFSQETTPLGTGGALRLAFEKTNETALVLNGDSFIGVDLNLFIHFCELKKANALLLTQVEDLTRYGAVIFEKVTEQVVSFEEKGRSGPGLINAGIYYLAKKSFLNWPLNAAFSLEKDVFPHLVAEGLYGFCTKGQFIDIGTPESYRQVAAFFKNLEG